MPSDATKPALTPKQQRFVENYLLDLNATQAAIRAGYSERTAQEISAQLLAKPHIRDAIDAAKTKRSKKTEIRAERVLKEIADMAFYDPADLIEIAREIEDYDLDNAQGAIVTIDGKQMVLDGIRDARDIKNLPENVRRAIVGWGYDRNQNFTLKLADKSKALDQLARHLSLYNDRLEVTGLDALADRLARAAKRDG
jgi:phage terminase small subunit